MQKNIFQAELRILFESHDIGQDDMVIAGNSCYMTKGGLVIKASFQSSRCVSEYDSLQVKVISRDNGVLDIFDIPFSAVWQHNEKLAPYIYIEHCEEQRGEWYSYEPDTTDRNLLRDKIRAYVDMFAGNTGKE